MAAARARPNYRESIGDGEKDINDSGWSLPDKADGEGHWCRAIPEHHAALLLYARPGQTGSKL